MTNLSPRSTIRPIPPPRPQRSLRCSMNCRLKVRCSMNCRLTIRCSTNCRLTIRCSMNCRSTIHRGRRRWQRLQAS